MKFMLKVLRIMVINDIFLILVLVELIICICKDVGNIELLF